LNNYLPGINISRNNIATPRKVNEAGSDTSKMSDYTIVDERRNMLGRILGEKAKLDQLIAKPETTEIQRKQMLEAKDRLKAVEAKFITHLASLDQEKTDLPKLSLNQDDSTSPESILGQPLLEEVQREKLKLNNLLNNPSTTAKQKSDINLAMNRLNTVETKLITHLSSSDKGQESLPKDNIEATNPETLISKIEAQRARLDSVLLDPSTTEEEKIRLNAAKERLVQAGDKLKQPQPLL
jgi:hypothetical protein